MNDSTDYVIEKGTAIKIHGNPYVLKEHAVVSGACDPARWRPAHEAFFTDESDDPNDIRQPDCAEANPNKPPQGRLGWFDRLLLKVAMAKAGARGYNTAVVTDGLRRAFLAIDGCADVAEVPLCGGGVSGSSVPGCAMKPPAEDCSISHPVPK